MRSAQRGGGSNSYNEGAPVSKKRFLNSQSDNPKPDFYTTADIARKLRRKGTKSTERKFRAGKFPGGFQDGRTWLIRVSDFEAWVEGRIARAAES